MADTPANHQWRLPENSREQLRQLFKELVHPVSLHVVTLKGTNDVFNEFVLGFASDIAHISDKISFFEHAVGSDFAKARNVTDSPTVLVEPERYGIRFAGSPLGEEGRTFLEAILAASRRDSGLSKASREALAQLSQKRTVKVFVTPTCPYCPAQAVHAVRAAVERPDLVEAWCVEIGQMPHMGDRYGVGSVPQTNFNDALNVLGMEPEERFIDELIRLEDAGAQQAAPRHAPGETIHADCLILGAGPAGLTAGIYAGRAGMKTVILERGVIGGQVSLTPVVENYPGFANIPGLTLMEIMAAQARQYCEIIQEEPASLAVTPEGITAATRSYSFTAKALLIATGATWRRLGVPGEDAYFGRGVNYCATCDGYLYKGRRVLVVGGGNTALTDALYLKNLGVDVTIVHRRDAFRAERHLSDSVRREGVPALMGHVVEEILGDVKVTGARLRDVATGEAKQVEADGVFVAIGETPNSEPARLLGCELTGDGFVAADQRHRTSVPRVYAAGDVTGGVRQIITAVGQGGSAALAIFEDLASEGAPRP